MREKIIGALKASIDELNSTRPADSQVPSSEQTALLGDGGTLDSMAAVNFLMIAEQRLSSAVGQKVSLAERVMLADASDGANLPTTLSEFADFVETILGGE